MCAPHSATPTTEAGKADRLREDQVGGDQHRHSGHQDRLAGSSGRSARRRGRRARQKARLNSTSASGDRVADRPTSMPLQDQEAFREAGEGEQEADRDQPPGRRGRARGSRRRTASAWLARAALLGSLSASQASRKRQRRPGSTAIQNTARMLLGEQHHQRRPRRAARATRRRCRAPGAARTRGRGSRAASRRRSSRRAAPRGCPCRGGRRSARPSPPARPARAGTAAWTKRRGRSRRGSTACAGGCGRTGGPRRAWRTTAVASAMPSIAPSAATGKPSVTVMNSGSSA